MIRRPPRSPLFPYPPLFRSALGVRERRRLRHRVRVDGRGLTAPAAVALAEPPAGDPPDRRDRAEHQRENADDQADRKSTRLNSSHANISYAVFCLKKKKKKQ